jgi:hypothetical protein
MDVLLTNGSGSWGPKNMPIRNPNTALINSPSASWEIRKVLGLLELFLRCVCIVVFYSAADFFVKKTFRLICFR